MFAYFVSKYWYSYYSFILFKIYIYLYLFSLFPLKLTKVGQSFVSILTSFQLFEFLTLNLLKLIHILTYTHVRMHLRLYCIYI